MKDTSNLEIAIWCFIGVYMALAFIAGDANPSNWTNEGRGVFVFISGIATGFALIIKHTP